MGVGSPDRFTAQMYHLAEDPGIAVFLKPRPRLPASRSNQISVSEITILFSSVTPAHRPKCSPGVSNHGESSPPNLLQREDILACFDYAASLAEEEVTPFDAIGAE
jgi:hypothetical protein